MDCRMESAAVSLLRIEAIVIQGLTRALLMFAIGMLSIPAVVLVLLFVRIRVGKGSFIRKVASLPFGFLISIAIAVAAPFADVWRNVALTKTIARAEWKERWRYGSFKTLDGNEASIPTEEERAAEKVEFARQVVADYGWKPTEG